MKINKLSLHNFKSFEGTCNINGLSDTLTSEKRIILFGGLNGAGKTTIFEAILLCLYGKRNRTLWPSKGAKREDYQNYIVAVTNNNAKQSGYRTEMWIEIALSDIELGGISESLTVRRTWIINCESKSLHKEELKIFDREGNDIEFVSQENWEEFINEIIPYEVSQFFFFDGEKIQEFVKDEDKEFASSLEKVLGITLYEQLKNDLETVRRRILQDYNKDVDIRVQITNIESEIAQLEVEKEKRKLTIERITDEIKQIDDRVEEIDRQTRRITRVQADTLDQLREDKERLSSEKLILEEKIFQAIQEDIPFVMTARLCDLLNKQLENELQLNEFIAAQKALEPKIDSIIKRLFEGDEPFPPVNQIQKDFYKWKLEKILKEVLAEMPEDLIGVSPLHSLSKFDYEQIKSRLLHTRASVSTLTQHLNRLNEIEDKLRKINQTEIKTDDPDAAKLYEERGKLLQERSFKERASEHLRSEIINLDREIISKKRKRTELEKEAERSLYMRRQMEYSKKLGEALEEFSHRLRVKKVDKLQEYTLMMWERLAHKKDQVKSIRINPDRQFTIELYDSKNRLLDKTKLSAGEKELLAISLIWALAKLANRNLPVIIDTPLGRLDTVHRANIARNYFSNASHQVILLSTNTEIVRKEYEAIQPFISKQFLIEKDKAEKTSRIIEGYFSAKPA